MRILLSLYKSQLKTLISKHETYQTLNQHCFKRSYSIIHTSDASTFRTSFLENQCGLSGKSLIRASHLLNFEPSDERPLSVLKLLQTFGFPQHSITKIISTYPHFLQFHSQKTLKPKLDFLLSITQSESDVVRIVTVNPVILGSSLNNQLIPSFNLLKSVTGSYRNAASLINSKPTVVHSFISKSFYPNIQLLLAVGVPCSQIVKLATGYGTVLGKKHDDFSKLVMKIKDMGFDPSSSYFNAAVQSLCFVTDSTWESRCEVFRRFGFSSSDICSMFKKRPAIATYSEKKVRRMMEFFMNKLGWSPSRLSANPAVLGYSLEKRTIPRCSVLQVLVTKNKTNESFMLSTILAMVERNFLKYYITPYKNEIPEIMDAYRGQLKFDVYTFKQKSGLSLMPDINLRPVISSS